ncbi:hypothetical protein ACJQWK_11023 [Exserohilum turcicum]
MKSFFTAAVALATTATAHYTFPDLTWNDKTTGDWVNVRQTANYQSNGPVQDVTSDAIRCYQRSPSTTAKTLTVKAGDTLGFKAGTTIGHPGPVQFYMAKVPEGKTAATWDGSGEVWFKVSSEKAEITNGQIDWPSHGKDKVSFKTPSTLPKGEYLLRIEHIALHSASSVGGAQFYISCAQVNVEGSGTGNPGPKVAFPGAYKATDPGVQVNIYYPVPTNYAPPGPAVWLG